MTDRPAPAALSDTTVPSTTPTTDLPTTTEDRMSTQPTTSTTVEAAAPTSAERLSGGEPYILAFGGQATPWRTTLDELVGLDRELAAALVGLDAAVAARLAPVATDLLTITPRGARFLNDDAAPVAPATVATGGAVADTADISVPGILFAQHAAIASLPAAGVPVTSSAAPAAVIGHSQGVLGVALLEAMAECGSEAIGIDHRIPLDEAARRLPGKVLQGNIDPARLAAGWENLAAHTRDVVERGRSAPAHVVNLGHGVPPETDPAVLTDLVALVHEL